MDDQQERKRVPESLESGEGESEGEVEDYTARAYASVPKAMDDGQRGYSSRVIIIGFVVLLIVVGAVFFSWMSRNRAAAAGAARPGTHMAIAAPALSEDSSNPTAASALVNGVAANSATAGDPSFDVTATQTTAPFTPLLPNPIRTPFVAHSPTASPTFRPYGAGPNERPAVAAAGQQPDHLERSVGAPTAPAPTVSGPDTNRMTIEPPPRPNPGSVQDPQAFDDLNNANQRLFYKPVYNRDGSLAGVYPVPIATPVARLPAQYGGQPGPPTAPYGQPSSGTSYGQPGYGQQSPDNRFFPQPSQGSSGDEGAGPGDDQNAGTHQRWLSSQDNANVGYVPQLSDDQIAPGTKIYARLESKIVTTLPGPVTATVVQPVLDARTNSKIVIPAGAKLFGTYESALAKNQNRALTAFTRLIFPDGEEFAIGAEPATDAQGAAGMSGDTDYHRGALYTDAILLTLLSGVQAGLSGGSQERCQSVYTGQTVSQAITCGTTSGIADVGKKLLDRQIDRTPTLIIRPPYAFTVIVTRDLPLDQYRTR